MVESLTRSLWRRLRGAGAALGMASVLALAVACGDSGGESGLSGNIQIDGSSTVFPITEAVAEEFRVEEPDIHVTVGISGTGGGFQKFCNGETVIQDASRPITAGEAETCRSKGVEFIELPVAFDALSVVVNPQNNWVTCITVAELKKIWEPAAQGVITNWNQVNSGWANASLRLFGPGTDSGTFDYFTEHVNGKAKDSRGDYTPSEDDNVLVQGVAGDRNALGYFGLAYYEENKGRVKALQVDGGNGRCVEPSAATVESGEYPLSRPLFIYVRADAASRPEVKAFVDFYIENVDSVAADVGYVKFPARVYELVRARWQAKQTGSTFSGKTGTVEQLLAAPQ